MQRLTQFYVVNDFVDEWKEGGRERETKHRTHTQQPRLTMSDSASPRLGAMMLLSLSLGVLAIGAYFIGQGYAERKSKKSIIAPSAAAVADPQIYANLTGGIFACVVGFIAAVIAVVVIAKS